MLDRAARLLTVAFLLEASQAYAIPVCGSQAKQLRDSFDPLVHQVLVVGESERETFRNFATKNGMDEKALMENFSASGRITCTSSAGTYYGSAQLTLRNNVLVTAGHVFLPGEGCNVERVDPTKCSFTIEGRPTKYRVKKLAATGLNKDDCVELIKTTNDWAVVVLEDSVEDVKPFAVASEPLTELRQQPKVLVTGYSGDFFARGKNERHIGRCSFKRPDSNGYSAFYSDCDSSRGASGSGTFRDDPDNPTLLGILVDVSGESISEYRQAVRSKKPNQKPWGLSAETGHVTIAREFRRALLKAADEN